MVSLEQAKTHLRVDHADEDVAILAMIEAATQSIANYLDMTDAEITQLPLRAPVEAAVLLRVGDLYLNREAAVERPLMVNPTFERLLWPYRKMAL